MPVEILKASVGEYSVNSNSRGVTVNQHWLGDASHDWGLAKPVHEWYLKNPKATVAQVAEELDKLPQEIEVCGYKIKHWRGYLDVNQHLVSSYPKGSGDHVIQYLRNHYKGNCSTDIAECARLIREYLEPGELVVQGYRVKQSDTKPYDTAVIDLKGAECNPGECKMRYQDGEDCPVIAYLRTVMTPQTTVRETAKLIEDFLGREVVVRGVRVYKAPVGQATWVGNNAQDIKGLTNYLWDKNYQQKTIAEVAKLIEDYREPVTIKGATVKMTKDGVVVENAPKGFFWVRHTPFDTVVARLKEYKPPIRVTIEIDGDKHTMDCPKLAIELLNKLV